jgi:hypothetical protein
MEKEEDIGQEIISKLQELNKVLNDLIREVKNEKKS